MEGACPRNCSPRSIAHIHQRALQLQMIAADDMELYVLEVPQTELSEGVKCIYGFLDTPQAFNPCQSFDSANNPIAGSLVVAGGKIIPHRLNPKIFLVPGQIYMCLKFLYRSAQPLLKYSNLVMLG